MLLVLSGPTFHSFWQLYTHCNVSVSVCVVHYCLLPNPSLNSLGDPLYEFVSQANNRRHVQGACGSDVAHVWGRTWRCACNISISDNKKSVSAITGKRQWRKDAYRKVFGNWKVTVWCCVGGAGVCFHRMYVSYIYSSRYTLWLL